MLLPVLLFGAGGLNAEVMIMKGDTAVYDDFITEENPNQNHGITTSLEFGTKSTGGGLYDRKTMIKPEMTQWHNHGSVIDSVCLVLYTSSGLGNINAWFYINRLLVDAAYGNSGSIYCPTDSAGMVYNAYYCLCDSLSGTQCSVDSIPWNVTGCSGAGSDFVATVSDSFQLGRDSFDSCRIYLTDDFKWFCDHPDSAFGWVIWRYDDSPLGNYRTIVSTQSNYENGAYQPRLEIYYSPSTTGRRRYPIISRGLIGE